MKTKIFTLLFVLIASAGTILASDIEVDGIWYNFDNSTLTAEVTYRGSGSLSYLHEYSGAVTIPSSVMYCGKTYSVTSIGEFAFAGCSSLTSVTISNSVTSIGGRGFSSCSQLSSVIIGNSVTSIRNQAFYGCTSLKSIDIPNSVISIEQHAFSGCSGLSSVDIPNSVTSIGDEAFYNCAGLTSVIIGEGITSIGKDAFSGCKRITAVIWNAKNSNGWNFGSQVSSFIFGEDVEVIPASLCKEMTKLTNITIPNSVTSIGNNAFGGCTGLTSPIYNAHVFAYLPISYSGAYTIPEGIKSIAGYAFYDCSGLTSVTIPDSVTGIGYNAFGGCTGLKSVTIHADAIVSKSYSSSYNFKNIFGSQVTNYIISEGVTSIGEYAFSGIRSLTSVTIGNSVTNIGEHAFDDCPYMKSVTIGNNVASVGRWALYGCTGLTSIEIPNSVTSIGDNAFGQCSNLKKVIISDIAAWCNINFSNSSSNPVSYAKHLYLNDAEITNLIIPNSVTSIGNYAFNSCVELTSVTIGNSVTSIGEHAFDNCPYMKSVTIGNNVTSIGEKAFYGCSSLTSIILPNSVTSIGEFAFAGCSSLTPVTIGNSVTSIGGKAFYGCSSLTSIDIPNSVISIGSSAFENCTGLTSVTIGDDVTSIGENAFYGCSSLTSIILPNSVTSIGNYAFYNCSNLTSIYVPCGELERFKQLIKIDSKVKYQPLSYKLQINSAANGNVVYPQTICDELVLNAIPDYGYHFVKWSDGNTENPRAFELTQDTTFEASFAINNYTINLQKNHTEMGFVTGGGTFEYLSQHTITATPNYGYHFVQWNGVGQQIPQNAISTSQAYTIASALSSGEATSTRYTIVGYVTGKYGTYTNSYYLSDNPTVSGTFIAFKCASSANIGDYVLVTGYLTNYKGTTPETTSGSSLTKIDSPYSNPYSFTLTCDTTIIAEFTKNIYSLTLKSANTTMGSVTGGGEFEYLTKCTIKATPNYGYHFAKWADGNTNNPRIVELTKDTMISAIFGKNPVIKYIYDSSMGYVEGDTTLASQATGNITFKAVPYPGYKFVQWSDGNHDNPRTINLTQNTTMKAIFAIATKGNCGKGYALTWTLDTTAMALNIVGDGELTENYTYGSFVQKVSIGANVTDIGLDAFEHCQNIKHVTLNSNSIVGKDYYYSFSANYIYTLTKIFGSGVEEYAFGGHIEGIGRYAFYGSNGLKSVVIPEGCKYIGDYAFYGAGNITSISIPSTVTYIGVSAFTTESILKVYNYSATPQDMSTNTYSGLSLTLLRGVLASARLYVPQQSIELYRDAYFWCYFGNILPLQTTPVETVDMTINVTETTVTVVWPSINGATSYELVIIDKSGNVVCTLIFNEQGQLTSIAFNAPGHRSPHQTQTAGFSFTVTGLDSGTGYDLILTAKNSSGTTLNQKTISFTTDGLTTPLDQITNQKSQTTNKFFRNGQLFIQRGGKTYSVTGQEVE